MKPLKLFLIYTLLLPCILFTNSCSSAGHSSSDIVFVGSTPGDELIKSLLTIHPETKVDFIRWDLTLTNTKFNQNTFVLNIAFGEAQPNTLGFKEGGKRLSFKGEYSVSKSENRKINRDIYHLKSSKLPTEISMVKLNDNLFHLLTPKNQLVIGNGSWSYTLNRKEPIACNSIITLPAFSTSASLLNDSTKQVVFEARTACDETLLELNSIYNSGCNRVKMRLTLHQNIKTFTPTTFELKTVYVGNDNTQYTNTGNWTVKANSDIVIYQLDFDNPKKSLFLMKGDDNVLFFLDKNNILLVGNSDLSYTLNKRRKRL